MSFYLFAVFNGLRVFSYLPQIHRIAVDTNGASAISYATWALWTGANLTTALYAHINLDDAILTAMGLLNAACCVVVIGLTVGKRKRHAAMGTASAGTGQARPARYAGNSPAAGRSLPDPANDTHAVEGPFNGFGFPARGQAS